MDGTEKMDSESSDVEALNDWAQRPSTLPPVGVELRCFPTEDLAKSVGTEVESWLFQFGKLLNLKRLLRVVVAYDYEATLTGIDRGASVSRPLVATNNGIAVGIAMTPTVLHEEEPRSVMVLNANYVSVLSQPESPKNVEARNVVLYTLAHESAHVHDLDMRASCFPGTILRKQLDFRDGILFAIASGCWEEYIACRLSAFIGNEVTLRGFEDTFCSALERTKSRADTAIKQYRMHGDVERVTREVAEEYKSVMVYASYLLGHIDGLEKTVEGLAPRAISTIETHAYFEPCFLKLHAELRTMHSSYGHWQGLEVFEPLKHLSSSLLRIGGIHIQPRPDGSAHVAIPPTPETLPSVGE
jgi:hypothetical protein